MTTHSRIFIAALASVVLFGSASADYEPRKGHWRFEIVLKNEAGSVDAKTLSSASYPATCVSGMDRYADKVEESNGFVWLDETGQIIAYKPSDLAMIKHEVVEFRCKFYPWKD